jgi:hypothetical protein
LPSRVQGILYGHTGTTAAIEGPGIAEMIRRVDLECQIDGLLKKALRSFSSEPT